MYVPITKEEALDCYSAKEALVPRQPTILFYLGCQSKEETIDDGIQFVMDGRGSGSQTIRWFHNMNSA